MADQRRQPPAQIRMGAVSAIVAGLALVAGLSRYVMTSVFWAVLAHKDFSRDTVAVGKDQAALFLLAGGLVAVVLAVVGLLLKGRRRGWAIAGLVAGLLEFLIGLVRFA